MKKLFTSALVLVALVLPASLYAQQSKAAPSPEVAKMAQMLQGTWEWKESRFASRGATPWVKTPESEKQIVTLNFRPDNLASLYINKKPAGTYQYTLTRPTDYVLISFRANEGQPLPAYFQEGPITITDNELLIAGGYNDAGQNVTFRKAGTKPTAANVTEVKPIEAKPAPVLTPVKKPVTQNKTTVKNKTAPGKIKTESKTTTKN